MLPRLQKRPKSRIILILSNASWMWVEKVEQILKKAEGLVNGVQKERGINVKVESFTIDQMVFRVGWWMENTDDYFKLRLLVNQAIVKELKGADILMPYRKGRFEVNPTASGARDSNKKIKKTSSRRGVFKSGIPSENPDNNTYWLCSNYKGLSGGVRSFFLHHAWWNFGADMVSKHEK